MKISHKYLLVPGALIAFLAAFPVETFCQAFVLGKNPSFTALNLRNKKALDDVLLEVRYLFTWSKFHDSSQPHTEQRTILVGRNTQRSTLPKRFRGNITDGQRSKRRGPLF